jgi:hypothetical protein
MGVGQSWGGALLLKTESTYGTGADLAEAATTIPVTSETFAIEHPRPVYGNILTSRVAYGTAPGVISATGGFTMEADAVNVGLPLFYWNGQATSAALAGLLTKPTVTAGPGGALPAGEYYYKVAAVVRNSVLGLTVVTGASAVSDKATATAENGTITVGWTNPTTLTLPSGWAYFGTAVYRTAKDGASGSERLLHFETGTGVSWADATTSALGTAIPPATIYQHIYVPAAVSAATHPLGGFSVGVLKDNDESEQYIGCRMNTFSLSLGDQNAPVEVTFEAMAQTAFSVANLTPSPSIVAPLMNWQAQVLQNDTAMATVEALELTATNNLEPIPQLAGKNYVRDFYPGERTVTGTLTVAFEDHTQWDKMLAGTPFELSVWIGGQATTALASFDDGLGNTIASWPYGMRVDLWNCVYTGGGANLSGRDRLVAQFPFVSTMDSGEGEEMQVTVYNQTASYA